MVPEEIRSQLIQYGITEYSEVALRETLEQHTETYTLFKLAPWPARRWKCHYRVMMGAGMYDAQTVAEAYALALLALLSGSPQSSPTQ
jgi:hypothetical protein